ncbi:MAG TPA: ABC transporter ATP-binding protein [Candidatus Polarisedimenticolia bacterium]|nr:ABC transporter ATP-binding protein [Candidatus Polarisedimenticolia bacterium]
MVSHEDPAPVVRFLRVSRHFGEVRAVDDVSLDILDGEFFSMLGPSGSGKTTCLRLIAGFDRPTGGRIELHGSAADRLPPYERDVNTVFQDYALFPHMTVAENVAYGLMIRKVPPAERDRRAAEMLDLVRLPGVASRRPAQLSGGQRQRVALARALINRPSVLLLDEPLGALDLKLRQQMQIELKSIQERLGITFVYVTHDQEEALAMSDRLAVFHNGRIEQVGTPAEVYEKPATSFVAEFVGISNLLHGAAATSLTGSPVPFTIRPEKIRLVEADAATPEGVCSAAGTIREVVYLGMHTRYLVEIDGGTMLTVVEQNREATAVDVHAARGRPVRLAWSRAQNRPVGEGR